ncbi:MAG: hypothetical protein AAF958_02590 [Planctomycetota bacterium]
MAKNNDPWLSRIEREQNEKTRRRRGRRLNRNRTYALLGLAALGLLILAGPTIAGVAGLGKSIALGQLRQSGWNGNLGTVRVGWLTPLTLRDLKLESQSGDSIVEVVAIDCDYTLLDWLRGKPTSDLGQIRVLSPRIQTQTRSGRLALLDDIDALMASDSSARTPTGTIVLEDLSVVVNAEASRETWQWDRVAGHVDFDGGNTKIQSAGVLSDHSGAKGGFDFSVWIPDAGSGTDPECQIQMDLVPLSVLRLAADYVHQDSSARQAVDFGGDASGSVHAILHPGGTASLDVKDIALREFRVAFDDGTEFRNREAKLDGVFEVKHRLISSRGTFQTDFARGQVDATVAKDISLTNCLAEPARVMESIRGHAEFDVDLSTLQRAFPSLIPLRRDLRLTQGSIHGILETPERSKVKLELLSKTVRGSLRDRVVAIQPLRLSADLSLDPSGNLVAHAVDFQSSFGTAAGSGDLRSGNLNFDLNFDSLAAVLNPFVELQNTPSGQAGGRLRWLSDAVDRWQLDGTVDGRNIQLPRWAAGRSDTAASNMPLDFDASVHADGRIVDLNLTRLEDARLDLRSGGDRLVVQLRQPVDHPGDRPWLPCRYQVAGNVPRLWQRFIGHDVGGFRPTAGKWTGTGLLAVSRRNVLIGPGKWQIDTPAWYMGTSRFSQPDMKLDFDGRYDLAESKLSLKKATLVASAFTAAVGGDAAPDRGSVEMHLRTDLDRLRAAGGLRVADRQPSVSGVSYRTATGSSGADALPWQFKGNAQGRMTFNWEDAQHIQVGYDFSATDVSVLQPKSRSVTNRNASSAANRSLNNEFETVWFEKDIGLRGQAIVLPQDQGVQIQSLRKTTTWSDANLAGFAGWNDSGYDLQLDGQTQLDMADVADRLSPLTGIRMRAAGIVESPVSLHLHGGDENHFVIATEVGWQNAEIGGLQFGATRTQIQMDNDWVVVDPATIPVRPGGRLRVGGRVAYREGRRRLEIPAGPIAEDIELTREITDRWLKYLAPVVAQAADVHGKLGIDLNDSMVDLERPAQSRVSGAVKMQNASMNAGPMVQNLINVVSQARRMAGIQNDMAGSTLVNMPPQIISFRLQDHWVTHDRMQFSVDRADVLTSGRVSTAGQLDMVGQIPIQRAWVGRDLGSLAGATISLPITGTLNNIQVDTRTMSQIFARVAAEAGRDKIDQILRKEISRPLEKWLGKQQP